MSEDNGYQLQSHRDPFCGRTREYERWEVESVAAEQMVLLFRPIPFQGVHMYAVH